jgi:hemerythrin-like domain-containing protein
MPIKRSESLVPLSHDHHHGLVVVRHIRNGLKLKTHPGRITAYVRDFWQGDLQRHFKEEETVVFSLLPQSDPGIQQALLEHRQLSSLIEQMDDESEAELFAAFADLLETHIRFEERRLFPAIEQRLSMGELLKVGEALQHSTVPACWKDEFWKA